MPQQITLFGSGDPLSITLLLMNLGIGVFLSLMLSWHFKRFGATLSNREEFAQVFPFVLLTTTLIITVVKSSLALSLGLVGALSIVRFRTPIKEPEEIGFIMLVIAASLSCATFNLLFLGVILVVAVAALLIIRLEPGLLKGRLNDGMLVITLPSDDYQSKSERILNFLEKKLPRGRIDSIAENHEESVISYSFIRMEKKTLVDLPVELKKLSKQAKSNVFFNRSGEV